MLLVKITCIYHICRKQHMGVSGVIFFKSKIKVKRKKLIYFTTNSVIFKSIAVILINVVQICKNFIFQQTPLKNLNFCCLVLYYFFFLLLIYFLLIKNQHQSKICLIFFFLFLPKSIHLLPIINSLPFIIEIFTLICKKGKKNVCS